MWCEVKLKLKWIRGKGQGHYIQQLFNVRAVECGINIWTAKRVHQKDIHRGKNNQGTVCFKSLRRRPQISKMLLWKREKGLWFEMCRHVNILCDILSVVCCQFSLRQSRKASTFES